MRLCMLYGVHCTVDVWRLMKPYLSDFEIDFVVYPHDITACAERIEDICDWVYATYGHQAYDAMIGHSLGGIIALQLRAKKFMQVKHIICLDTNLKPAKAFYRNVMTNSNMERYGQAVTRMFETEKAYYTSKLLASIQGDFDYTNLVRENAEVHLLYGDRCNPTYPDKYHDLNLPRQIFDTLHIGFIKNACHMPMLENPKQLSEIIRKILNTNTLP